ncbi:MAG: sulfotransferase [Chloroflexi bacterium]|nr:sulfotransferase [Chloroflexota bacterium]MBP8055660.1 sulfotransferase [Chloroflexota bacterium]
MDNHQFIFIGGLHRSGTSILFKTLRDHPQISGFYNTQVPEDEGQHLQTVIPPAKAFGGAGLFGFHPEATLDETSPLVTAESRATLWREWSPYWDLRKPFLLEKSLPNLIRTRFLQALFPQAYFIILLRHPIPVTLATKKWRPRRPLISLLSHWFVCHERFQQDKSHLRHVLMIRYEDFVANPAPVLGEIWRFLGVAPMPQHKQEIRSNINGKYFQQWQQLENGLLGRFYARYMTARFEARAAQFGYSLKTGAVQPATAINTEASLV